MQFSRDSDNLLVFIFNIPLDDTQKVILHYFQFVWVEKSLKSH